MTAQHMVADSTTVAPLSNAEQIKNKIAELQTALKEKDPSYEGRLFQIHKALANDEDLAHILTEQEIGVICEGLSKKKGIVINEETAKKRSTHVALSKLTLDQL